MTGVVLDPARGDAVRAIQDNCRANVDVFARGEGARVDRGDDYVRWTSAVRLPLFNAVMGTVVADDLAAAVGAVLDPFDEQRLPCLWTAAPFDARLAAELETRGFEVERTPGFAIDLARLPRAIPPPGASIRQVDDDPLGLGAAVRIGFTTSGFPEEVVGPLVSALAQMPGRQRLRTFLVEIDGEPASAAMVYEAAGVAGLYSVGTATAFRMRGLGRFVSTVAMQAGRDDGYRVGVCTASEMGERVYRAMGFEERGCFLDAVRDAPASPGGR